MRLLSGLLFLLLFQSFAIAQESCVFLPLRTEANQEFDRPRASLHKKSSQQPQSQTQIANGEFPNINITQHGADQDETSIAINPVNPNIILAGANDYRSFNSLWKYVSTDGGLTWNNSALIPATNLSFATDPSVAFDLHGTAFYAYGRIDNGGSPYPRNDVVCYHATDGGIDFGEPARVFYDTTNANSAQVLADKYYVAVDRNPSSPYKDRIYVTWVEYQSGKSRIVLSCSSDHGITWSSRLQVTSQKKFQCPIPAVAPSGDLYIAFLDLDTTDQYIYVARIINGGAALSGSPTKVSFYKNLGPSYPPLISDPHPIIKGHLRVNSFPSITVDKSGKIYVVWAAKGNDNKHHIYLSTSTNASSSWSDPPKAIEDDTSAVGTDKFFPWIAADEQSGDIGVVFYDSRNDAPNNQFIDCYMAFSNDAGATFKVKRISDISFNPSISNSTDSISTGDTLAFFGDYNGLAGFDSVWYPCWTDSRNNNDQEIYFSIVRPYAPQSVKNFTAIEQTPNHYAGLNWEYDPKTIFDRPLGNYHFLLRRTDGGLNITLPSTQLSYLDNTVDPSKLYHYSIQAVTETGDTSISRIVLFAPRAARTSLPPDITNAAAAPTGFSVHFTVPSKNEAGGIAKGLSDIVFLIDDTLIYNFSVTDADQGKDFEKPFFSLTFGYHKFQCFAVTKTESGDTTRSALTPPVWLYAGSAFTEYSETFQDSKNIFTPYAWDTTSYGGRLSARFINDSMPGIPYQSNVNSWFVLPPVTISDLTHTLEFDHIALVAAGDAALVEFSTNDGLSFTELRFYDKSHELTKWTDSVVTSTSISEAISLNSQLGKDAIIRFRLATQSSAGDGWFINNVKFSDMLGVSNETAYRNDLHLYPIPVRPGSKLSLEFSTVGQSKTSITVYDMLGKKRMTLMENRSLNVGEYSFYFYPSESGVFYLMLETMNSKGMQKRVGRFIVLP